MAAARTPTPCEQRARAGDEPVEDRAVPLPVRLAVGDYDDDELAMELAEEFGIARNVFEKKRLGVNCEPGGVRGRSAPKAPAPGAPRRAPFMTKGFSCDPLSLAAVRSVHQQTE